MKIQDLDSTGKVKLVGNFLEAEINYQKLNFIKINVQNLQKKVSKNANLGWKIMFGAKENYL